MDQGLGWFWISCDAQRDQSRQTSATDAAVRDGSTAISGRSTPRAVPGGARGDVRALLRHRSDVRCRFSCRSLGNIDEAFASHARCPRLRHRGRLPVHLARCHLPRSVVRHGVRAASGAGDGASHVVVRVQTRGGERLGQSCRRDVYEWRASGDVRRRYVASVVVRVGEERTADAHAG